MKYFLIISVLSILNISNLYPQNEITKEFLVTENLDTLYGSLRKTSDVVHIEQGMYFKSSNNEKEIFYPTKDILAYSDERGRVYFKKRIPKVKDSAFHFLEILFSGDINLYRFQSEFYIEKEHKIYKLKDTYTDKKNEKGKFIRKHNKEYISTLSVILGDCFGLYDNITESELIYKDLVSLLEKYHKCKNIDFKIISAKSDFEVDFKFGLFLGGFTTLASHNLKTNKRTMVNGLSDQNFIFGGEIIFRINKTDNYYLIFSPQFSFGNEYFYENSSVNDYGLFNHELSYSFSQADLPVGFGLVLNNKKVQPFINSGIVFNRFWGGKYNYTIKRRPLDEGVESQENYADFYGDIIFYNNYGLWALFGLNYHFLEKVTFYNRIRYQTNNFYTNFGRVQGGGKIFNYHQFNFEFGVLF
ncbi:MAG: hypothetical protein ACQETL_02960 [Bacteroidota bacterium]